LEYVNCNICNTDSTDVLFVKKDKFRISGEDFNIVKCRNCGLIYINPRPTEEEIVRFYPDTYSWKETLKSDLFFTKIIRKLEKMYRYQLLNYEVNKVLVYTSLRRGKVLDIGCGTGDRLLVFRRKGFDVYGVEVSSSARYAKEYLDLNVLEGNLFKASFPDNFFDIITMHNVLEHVHRPKELLWEINRILKKGGFLVIQVPNTDSLQFAIFKDRWAAVDPPRDIYYFNSRLLKITLEKEDFGVVCIDYFSHWFHPPTLTSTFFPALDPQLAWKKESSGFSSAASRIFWIVLTCTIVPFFTFFESLVRKSSIVTLFAYKS
jgi:SAM-dependent methyltransferase